jgi:hypothetical protein
MKKFSEAPNWTYLLFWAAFIAISLWEGQTWQYAVFTSLGWTILAYLVFRYRVIIDDDKVVVYQGLPRGVMYWDNLDLINTTRLSFVLIDETDPHSTVKIPRRMLRQDELLREVHKQAPKARWQTPQA